MALVLGRFRAFSDFEPSGLVGAGDNIALRNLTNYFAQIGFKRYTVYYNDQIGWTHTAEASPLKANLVLLGGPDANTITRQVLERIRRRA
jgi:hypothetical protein